MASRVYSWPHPWPKAVLTNSNFYLLRFLVLPRFEGDFFLALLVLELRFEPLVPTL